MEVKVEFKTFFDAFFISTCRYVMRYVEEESVASDITQEVFMKVYEKWDEFDGEENAHAFLYTIARNVSCDYLRHKKIEMQYCIDFAEEQEDVDDSFLYDVVRQETYRMLYSAIDKLPHKTRQVILYSLEGDNLQLIGEKMGVSINTVKTLKKNAYHALRELIASGINA